MHDISLERDILKINEDIAERNKKLFRERGVLAINIMGAIGSGKTSLIEILSETLQYKIGVIVGDVISDIDANRLKKLGIPVIGVNTGKECHLDAHLIEHSLEKLPLNDIDILFIENVGNLICPVNFSLGAEINITVVSVTEGEDTVEKHPMIFRISDIAIINKIDLANAVGCNIEKMESDAKKLNPNLKLFRMSIKKKSGIKPLVRYIDGLLRFNKNQ